MTTSPKHVNGSAGMRFAVLIRVSTEKQEKQGESLLTQRKQVAEAVERLGGKVVRHYGGQEHATAGWERAERDKLLADAESAPRPFDAVMVQHEDRWSRDETQSGADIERLQRAGVRFYVLDREQDLYDPTVRLYLGMSAVIGAYHARNQSKKSIQNRIERAKRGVPTGGKLPFGRTYDKSSGRWDIVPEKQVQIEDIAERYLAGGALPDLAAEYSMNHSNLVKVLRERCGDKWVIEFKADSLKIDESVEMSIPRLLPEKTIRAVRQRLEANRTYLHGKPKGDCLLTGRIFCGTCGYGMCSQTNHNGHRYYRHAHTKRDRECPLTPRPWVRADWVEQRVAFELFNLLGNPSEIKRAVGKAAPEAEKLAGRRKKLEADLAKLEKARGRILGLIRRDVVSDEEAEKDLLDIRAQKSILEERLAELAEDLVDRPELDLERLSYGGDLFFYYDRGNRQVYPGGNDMRTWDRMSFQDKRELVQSALHGTVPDPDSRRRSIPAGAYVFPDEGSTSRRSKTWRLEIRGNLNYQISSGSVVPCARRLPSTPRYALPFLVEGSAA